jgi:NAD(P)H-hydrate repair Nnr-like enzyme with NAD(P)H-hydrate dehydratase domain
MSGFVIGPGLGRDFNQLLFSTLMSDVKNSVIVGDADFFWMISEHMNANPETKFKDLLHKLTKNGNTLVLTPNHRELARIYQYNLGLELPLEDLDQLMAVLEKPTQKNYLGYQ